LIQFDAFAVDTVLYHNSTLQYLLSVYHDMIYTVQYQTGGSRVSSKF
jgi:hypothetical protein